MFAQSILYNSRNLFLIAFHKNAGLWKHFASDYQKEKALTLKNSGKFCYSFSVPFFTICPQSSLLKFIITKALLTSPLLLSLISNCQISKQVVFAILAA